MSDPYSISSQHYDTSQDAERQRRQASLMEPEQAPVARPRPQRPATGFERFLERGLAMAGNRVSKKGKGGVFGSGWAKGLTRGQAIEKARDMYGKLDDSQRKHWEGQANLRDVRSLREIDAHNDYRKNDAAWMSNPTAPAPTSGAAGGRLVRVRDGVHRWVPDVPPSATEQPQGRLPRTPEIQSQQH